MAYDVEDKVVQMRFDNRDFDPNIDASIKSLEKLEKSLKNLDKTTGFENVEKSAKKFNLDPAVTAVESLKNGFSAMEVVAITAISNITSKAMAMGAKIMDAFAIAPLRSGFQEYSQQMDSTQVILSNLPNETLGSVTDSLDELNEYADRTIYSFGQMTQAIGKFAAAGVELKPATAAIKGLSSAAATVGANNMQLYSAYYNLAQSMQLGYMQLIDWKSLEMSTIGNRTMKDAFIKTAEAMGTFEQAGIKAADAYADFRGTLNKKWLTSDVIIATLNKYSRQIKKFSTELGDSVDGFWEVDAAGVPVRELTEVIDKSTGEIRYRLESTGELLEQWEVDLASTAFKSATEIKSFSQMWDTLTEAAGTGWAETWKIIFGDLEHAKKLWTGISKPIEKTISLFNDLRNNALKAWANFGGQEDLMNSLIHLSEAFGSIAELVGKTLEKFIGVTPIAGENVSNLTLAMFKLTDKIKIFTEYLTLSDTEIEKTSDGLAKLLQPLKIIGKILGFIGKVGLTVAVIAVAIGKALIQLVASIGLIPDMLREIFGEKAIDNLSYLLGVILELIVNIGGALIQIGQIAGGAVITLWDSLKSLLATIFGINEESISFQNVVEKIALGLAFVVEKLNLFVTWLRLAISAIREFFVNGTSNLNEYLTQNGSTTAGFFISGVTTALEKGLGKVKSIGSLVGQALVEGFRGPKGIDAHSPAKTGIEGGSDYIDGVNIALTSGIKTVADTAAQIGSAISSGVDGTLKAKTERRNRKGIETQIEQANRQLTQLEIVQKKADEQEKAAKNQTSVITKIGTTIATVFKNVKDIIANISLSKVLIIAFSASIIALIFSVVRAIGEFKEVLEGLGRIAKATAARIYAEAFDQLGQALFSLAKSLALIVLIAHFDPNGLKQAVVILGIFIGVLTALVIAFSRLFTVTEKLKSIGKASEALKSFGAAITRITSLISISLLISSMSLSMMMLAESLKTLSEIDTKGLVKGILALTVLLGVLTAIIVVLGKASLSLTGGAFVLLAYGLAMKIFSKAISQLKDNINPYIEKFNNMTTKQIVLMFAMIASLTVLSVAIAKASAALSKVILSLASFAIKFGVMVFLMGIFKNNTAFSQLLTAITSTRFIVTVMASFAGMIVIFAVVAVLLMKYMAKTNIDIAKLNDVSQDFSKAMSSFARSIMTMTKSIVYMALVFGIMAKLFGADIATKAMRTAAISLLAMSVMVGTLIFAFTYLAKVIQNEDIDASVFDQFAKTLRRVAVSISIIMSMTAAMVAGASLFWHVYKDNPSKGWMVLGSVLLMIASVCGIIAGTMAVIGKTFKNDSYKSLTFALIPLIAMIGELLVAVALFSTIDDPRTLIPGILAVLSVMVPIIVLISQMHKLLYAPDNVIKDGDEGEKDSAVETLLKEIISVLAASAVLIGEIAVISALMSSKFVNIKGLVGTFIGFGMVIGLVVTTIVLLNKSVNGLLQIIDQMNPDKLAKARYMISTTLDSLRDILIVAGTIILAIGAAAFAIGNSGMNFASIALVLGSIGAILYISFSFISNILKILFNNANKLTDEQIKAVSIILDNVRDILIVIGSIILGIGAALMAIGHNGLSGVSSAIIIGTISATLASILIALGSFVYILFNTAKNFTESHIQSISIILNNVRDILIVIGAMILAIGAAVFAIGRNSRSAGGSIAILTSLGGLIVAIFGTVYVFMKKYNSLPNINNVNVAPLIIIFSLISGFVFLIGGVTSMLGSINIIKFITIISGLMGAVAAISGLSILLVKASQNTNVNLSSLTAMISTIYAISVAIAVVAGALLILSTIDGSKVETVTTLLWQAVKAMVVMGAVAAVLGVVFEAAGPWSAIVVAVFGAMTLALLAWSAAVYIIASAPLDKLITFFDDLTKGDRIKGLWAFVGAMSALAIGLTLGGPGLLIAAALLLSLALAFTSLAASVTQLVALSEQINLLTTSLTKLKGCLGTLIGVLVILAIFSPILVILALALSAPVIALGALTLGLAKLIQVSQIIPEVLLPVVQSLVEVGKVIKDNIMSFVSLAGVIALFGIALAIAAPGLLALAVAIGIVAISLGLALGLASPFVLALGTALGILIKMVTAAKDALIILFNTVIDRLPEIAKILTDMAPMAEQISIISGALLTFGIALLAIGAGGVLAAVGIIALGGAFKLLSIMLNSMGTSNAEVFDKIASLMQTLSDNTGAIAGLGGVLTLLGLGLIVLSAGALGAALGLAALGGALALLSHVAGSFETMMAGFDYLLNNKGNIAGLGGVIAVLGIGMAILGAGTLVGAIGILAFSGAIATLIASAGSFDTLMTTVDYLLNNKANIALLALAITALGAGIFLFGTLSSLGAPGIMILASAMVTFSAAMMVSAQNVGNAMVSISEAFDTAVTNIVDGLTKIRNFVGEGVSAAADFVGGFVNTIGNSEVLSSIFNTSQAAGAAAVEGFRSKEGIDSHSDSKQMISAAKDFIGGFIHTVKNDGIKAAGKYCKEFGKKSVTSVTDGITEAAKKTKFGDVVSKGVDTVKKIWNGEYDWSKLGKNVKDALGDVIPSVDNLAGSYGDLGSSAGSAKGTIESLTDTLKNQMKIFERFTADEEIMDPKELINNMESQLRGMQNWANGIDELAVRGMSGPLLQYLSEMGPEGYKYVEAFLEMTESEFAEANELYSESLEMPNSVANQIGESYKRAGVEIVESMASGMSGSGAISSANDEIKDSITDNAEKTGEEVYKIAETEATATADQLADMAATSGEGTGWAYFTALNKWMDSDAARQYIASVQGKIQGRVFNFSNFDMAKAAAQAGVDGYQYIASNWDYHNMNNLKQLGNTSAKFIVEGYEEALTAGEYVAACQKAMYGLAATIIDAGNQKFDIHSPSKVTEQQGMYLVEGLVLGLNKYSSLAANASEEVGDESMNSLADTIKSIASTITDDMDMDPTIRPVLDLSNVYDGMNQLDTLFSTNQARIAGSAYMTAKNPEDMYVKQEAAYRRAMQESNMELINAIKQSDQPVTVNVTLNGDAADFFDAMVEQTRQTVASSGNNPLLIMNRKTINAGLA